MIWIRTPQKQMIYVGEEWRAFVPPESGRPAQATIESSVPDEERAAVFAHVNRAFDNGWPFAATLHMLHRDGSYRRMLAKGLPVAIPGQGAPGFVGSTIEIADADAVSDVAVWDRVGLDLATANMRRLDDIYGHILTARALAEQQNERKLVAICDLAIEVALTDLGLDYATRH